MSIGWPASRPDFQEINPEQSAAVRAQEQKDVALLYGQGLSCLIPTEACKPVGQKVEYDPVQMTEAEIDLYLRTSLQNGILDRERMLAELQQDGVVPDQEMQYFLAEALLLSENPSAEELLEYAEPLMPDADSPAALCATEALAARLYLQSCQVVWRESQRQKYDAQEAAVRQRLIQARQARRETEERLRQELQDEL